MDGTWRRRALAVAAGLIATAGTPSVAHAAGAADITVDTVKALSPRLTEYRLSTPALAKPTILRVLTPGGYDTHPGKRYPVLYLLHGCCDFDVDGAQAWTTHGEAEALTRPYGVIVVMPAAGKDGFYSDWYNGGAGGAPAYETYHVGELVPWVDAHFRTVAGRTGRALTGLSMGGFGAMSYAARHPDMFVAAAAFSGALDVTDPEFGNIDAANSVDGGAPFSVWGDPVTQRIRRRGANPNDLAANLQGLNLTVRTGNGLPGGPHGGGPDPVEVAVHQESLTFEGTLKTLGYPHVFVDYGPGAHTWPYWTDDLRLTLPTIMRTFAHPPAIPARITFRSIRPTWSQYGWTVALKRPVLEFSTLSQADADGFTLEGTGPGTVETPAVYEPGSPATLTIADAAATRTLTATADRDGRLQVPVDLGPASAEQQDTPGFTTTLRTARVTIAGTRAAVAASRCGSRRTVRFTLPRGARGVRVLVDGTARTLPRRGRVLTLSLRGLPKRAVVVRITARGGYHRTTTLHPCA